MLFALLFGCAGSTESKTIPATDKTTVSANVEKTTTPNAPASEAKTETVAPSETKPTVSATPSTTTEQAAPETKPTTNAPAPTVTSEPKVVEVKFTAKKWDFSPGTATVKKGDTVKLILNSVDVDHGISISQFNVNLFASAGQTKETTFVADKSGTFSFKCSVFCGSGHSTMGGQLIVTE